LKNPDDQRFILKVSDMFSQADVNELPSLSTGEALISGLNDAAAMAADTLIKKINEDSESVSN